jgi:hypothetical protein
MSDLYKIANSISGKWYFVRRNIVAAEGFSFVYIKYRFLRPLLKTYDIILKSMYGKEKPWLSPAAISILDKCLNSSMHGLEYGSGRSTRFFSKRLKQLVSIEHHQEWYDLVSQELNDEDIKNVTYLKIEGGRPESKKDIEKRYKSDYLEDNQNYKDYYSRVSDFPDSYFDFILIDGRARVECSIRAIPKLKSGGIFILDNSERRRYEIVHNELSNWKRINTTSGLTDTTIWFKP